MKSIRAGFWLILIVGLMVLGNVYWLLLDKTPPAWDQAAHLRTAILFGQKMVGDSSSSWLEIIRSGYGYPPLIHFLGGLWSLVFGLENISFLTTVFFVGLIVGIYFLLKDVLHDERWAVVGTSIFSLIPVIYDISRSFLLDLPLIMWVTWGLWFWVKSDHLKKNGYGLGLLMMLVLSSLTKLNGFIYFGPIGLWIIIDLLINCCDKSRPNMTIDMIVKLVVGGLIYGLLVGWWWLINWQNIWLYLTGLAGQGEKLTDPMNLGSWVTWIHYFRLFFWNQLTPLAAVLVVMLVGNADVDHDNKSAVVKNDKWFWWTFLIINYVVFTIIKNKDFRFVMPLLPVVVLLATSGLKRLWQKNQEITIWMGVFLFSYLGWFYVNNSYGWPIPKEWRWNVKTLVMGDGDLINITDYPVRSPKQFVWPNKSLIRNIIATSKSEGKQTMLVLVDIEQLNDNNLKMYRDLVTRGGDKDLEMHSVYVEGFDDWGQFNLVLVGSQQMEPAPFYATNLEYLKRARDYVFANPARFEKIEEYAIPNREKVYLMRVR